MRGSYRISAAELRAVVRRPTIMASVAIAQKVKKDKTMKSTKSSKKSDGAAKTKTDKQTKASTPKKVR
jgi:hypothetical protein